MRDASEDHIITDHPNRPAHGHNDFHRKGLMKLHLRFSTITQGSDVGGEKGDDVAEDAIGEAADPVGESLLLFQPPLLGSGDHSHGRIGMAAGRGSRWSGDRQIGNSNGQAGARLFQIYIGHSGLGPLESDLHRTSTIFCLRMG